MSPNASPKLHPVKLRVYLFILCLCLIATGVSWWAVQGAADQARSSIRQKQPLAKTVTKRKAQRPKKSEPPKLEPVREKDEFEEDAAEKQEWFLFQRTYPFDELPAEGRRQAWESRPPRSPHSLLQTWTPLGPAP